MEVGGGRAAGLKLMVAVRDSRRRVAWSCRGNKKIRYPSLEKVEKTIRVHKFRPKFSEVSTDKTSAF